MKRVTLLLASALLAFSGCGFGQGPNIFTRIHNRVHGISNVGAPCVNCEEPVHHGCDNCGSSGANYGGYEGTVVDSYESTPVSSTIQPSNPGTYSTVAPTYSSPITNRVQYPAESIISKPSR